MTDGVKFFISPGASGDSPTEEKLLRSHEHEAAIQGADFFNYGWVQGGNGIASKTSRGILETTIDLETMEVRHVWSDPHPPHATLN